MNNLTKQVLTKCFIVLFVYFIAACSDTTNLTEEELSRTPQAVLDEQAVLDIFNAQAINLSGKIHDEVGVPILSATINIVDSNFTTSTAVDGSFLFSSLTRRNLLLEIAADGYRSEYIPVYLQYSLDTNDITLPTIVLNNDLANRARMLFGGDVAFARRFLDPNENTPLTAIPLDDPTALIQASNPEPGTRNVLSQLHPYYQEADMGTFNFETPVTDTPATPHPDKEFVFFSLPGSLPAIKWLGVDYVSMGNNHVFDYLDDGVAATIDHLNTAGIPFAGIGVNSTQAFTAYRSTLKNNDYGFLGMTSIDGHQHSDTYVANASKGGAADLTQQADVTAAIQGEIASSHIPIVQYHTGDEYIFEPTSVVLSRIQLSVDENVPLLVLHHPHVAQGVGHFGNTYALLGLGNLAFDQVRLETMLGVMARVDINGSNVEHIRLLPVYLEAFAPQLIGGRLAHDFLRRLGEFSHDYGGLLYPYMVRAGHRYQLVID